MSELERNNEFPAKPRHEALGPAPTLEESREDPHNSKGVLTSQKQDDRLPQVPVATREDPNYRLQLKKHLEIPASVRIETSFPCPPEQSHAPPHNSNRDLTSLRQHERLPEFPVLPGEES